VNIWQTHRKKVDCLTHPAVSLGSLLLKNKLARWILRNKNFK